MLLIRSGCGVLVDGAGLILEIRTDPNFTERWDPLTGDVSYKLARSERLLFNAALGKSLDV